MKQKVSKLKRIIYEKQFQLKFEWTVRVLLNPK